MTRQLFIIFTILTFFATPSFAQDDNWGVPLQKPISSHSQEETAEQVWDNEMQGYLYEHYGSTESPEFLNQGSSSNSDFYAGGDPFDSYSY